MVVRGLLLLLIVASLALFTGCVERRISVGSDPPNAVVWLNDVEIGRTPVTVPFTYDGDYDVRIRLEKNVGTVEKPEIKRWYLHTHKQTQIPWYEIFGIDLLSALAPWKIVDEQIWAFVVPEVQAIPDDELIKRAKDLQDRMGPTTQPSK